MSSCANSDFDSVFFFSVAHQRISVILAITKFFIIHNPSPPCHENLSFGFLQLAF
jgi:hypothetical protein